jgi:flagellar basal-body rod protein FlgG
MIKGIYKTAASMVPRVRKHEVIANNIANSETAGFKQDSIFLRTVRNEQSKLDKLQPSWEVRMLDDIYTDYTQGTLQKTGGELDLAIEGDGFFVVETPVGEAYTRNGSFSVSPEGTLVDSQGNPVMTDAGELYVAGSDIAIGADGQIAVDGEFVGQLQIVDFPKPYQLEKRAGSLFVPQGDAVPEPVEGAMVRQGYLERSNVDVLREMVDMIDSYRAFETGQRMIQIQDESVAKATNDLGRV